MLKKSLITLSLLLSFGEAITLEPNDTLLNGNINVFMQYEEGEVLNNQDWVAIYKKGSSTVWENVIDWGWIKDYRGIFPGNIGHNFPAIPLDEGEYEARIFKNNSFTIHKSILFTVKEPLSNLKEVKVQYRRVDRHNEYVDEPGFQGIIDIHADYVDTDLAGLTKVSKPNKKDWVALYSVNDANAWENVIEWSWVSDLSYYQWKLRKLNLEEGDYEVRYFLNNSFDTHKKSPSFHVDQHDNPHDVETSISVNSELQDDNTYDVSINFEKSSGNKKDWIAIFVVGKAYKSSNVLKWSYNTNGDIDGTIDLVLPKQYKDKRLTAVLFSDDSYTEVTKTTFILQ